MSKFSSYFFFAIAAGLALNAIHEKGKVLKVNSNYLIILLSFLIMVGIFTSYIRLKSELSYIKAIEHKNGGDYNSMVKEIKNVNKVLYPYDPTKQPVEYYTSTGYYRQRKLDLALTHSLKAEKLSPNNPLVLHNTAGIYQSLKKYDKAVNHYKKMQKMFPNYIDPQINLLIIYSETDQIEAGKNLFNTLIKKDSLNPRLTPFKSKYSSQF
jgi:tetratricopeptide (TPR) repeat protein